MRALAFCFVLLLPSVVAPSVALGDPPRAAVKPAIAVKKPAGPVAASRGWHSVAPGAAAPKDASGRMQLVLQGLNHPDRAILTAHSDKGGFSAEDLDKAAHILRDPRLGNEHPVDPRTLDLVYRVAAHFNTPEVRIISGYRTPRPGSHSNHGNGRAIDCVFAGTSDEDVAKFAREEGYSGVGTYPVSGFVHLDVRDRSYFWVDNSGPGKKNRTRGILGDLAAKSDARAAARGDHPPSPFGISTDVDGALAAVTHPNSQGNAPEEDDEDEAGQ
jgi:uncharacterized protein YcbK (DUF882 family)